MPHPPRQILQWPTIKVTIGLFLLDTLRAHLYKKEKTHLSYQHFSVTHLSARASLLIPPLAFVRVAALAFTNTEAHSKAAGASVM